MFLKKIIILYYVKKIYSNKDKISSYSKKILLRRSVHFETKIRHIFEFN